MSFAASTGAPVAGDHSLDEIAAAAQRTLGCETVVITLAASGRSSSGERLISVAGVAGFDGRNLDDLRRGLTHLDASLDLRGRDSLGIPFLAGARLSGTGIVIGHGFAAVLATPIRVGDERLGTIYAFKREPGQFRNEAMAPTVARQAAIALDHDRGRPRDGSLDPGRGQSLAALDELVLSAHNFAELARAIEAAVAPLFGAEKTGIMVWDEEREVLQMVGGSFAVSREVALSCQIKVLDPTSNWARVFTTGRGDFSNAATKDPGISQEYVRAFGIEKLMTTPLHLAGRPIGVLHVANPSRDFTVADVETAASLTPRVAGALELARTLFKLRRQGKLEEILSSVAVAVASGESVMDFLRPAIGEVGQAVEANFVAMVPDGGEPAIWRHGHSPLEEVVLDEVSRRPGMRAYVVGPEKAGDPGWAVFYAPVHLSGHRIGTLAAMRTRAEPFAREERQALIRLAGLGSLSFATERYQQQRAELARLQERQRIADDLHDDVAQILFAAQLNLDAILEREPATGEAGAGIERTLGLLVRADTTIRKVIHQLSSPTSPEFDQRLAAAVARVEQEFSVAIHLQLPPAAVEAANRARRTPADALIKAAREAMVNAAKHAGPCRIKVQLTVTDRRRLLLSVVDDGVGGARNAVAAGHGLAAIRRTLDEHGGCLRVGQSAGGGTKVTASIPIEDPTGDSASTPVGDGAVSIA
ncbi:MAG: GAF domain-containing protein [Actinobacteria bacterium]|nr:GAF domain-containing protein [Actinomycetota bacterium]